MKLGAVTARGGRGGGVVLAALCSVLVCQSAPAQTVEVMGPPSVTDAGAIRSSAPSFATQPTPLLPVSVVAGSAIGTRYLLVSSFECSVPGCMFENAVIRYDGDTGNFLGVHILNVAEPQGLAINPRTGRLLVASRADNAIYEYDPRTGAFIRTFVVAGDSGLSSPQNLVFNSAGNLLVGSRPSLFASDAVNGILEFDGTTGAFVRVFVDGGTINPLMAPDCAAAPFCLRGATGMAFGPNGNLFVASGINNLVIEYDGLTGVFVGKFDSTKLVSPVGLAIRPAGTGGAGNVLVTSRYHDPAIPNDLDKVVEFDAMTRELVPGSGIFANSLVDPGPLLWHTNGNLLLAERLSTLTVVANDRIVERNGVTGSFTKVFTPPADTNLHFPTAMIEVAFGFASGDNDADGDRDLRDVAALQLCDQLSPSSACATVFDDDLSGTIGLNDIAVFLSGLVGPPIPCGADTDCDDANPCTADRCLAGECLHDPIANGSSCADALFCDGQETCQDGVCSGLIPCIDKDHCDEAADVCLECVESFECEDGNSCTDDVCSGGVCEHLPLSMPCDDGDLCTQSDFCISGVCQGGPTVDCDDGNACTDDSCDAAVGCRHVDNIDFCDDQSVCTLLDTCLLGICRGTDEIDCDDGDICTFDFCDAGLGCQHLFNNAACDDNDPCTENDACTNGVCRGTPLNCDDGVPCTVDTCSGGVCSSTPDDAFCDDGLFCDGVEICDPVANCVSPGDPCLGGGECANVCDEVNKTCALPRGTLCTPDGNECTDDVCDGTGTCGVNNTNPCDDGSACTIDDACSGGSCVGTTPVVCDDLNACTDDSCDPVTGCMFTNNDLNDCSDGDACNGAETCSAGVCLTGTPLACDDGNACTADRCDAGLGCVNDPLTGTSCDDGNACTDADVCTDGVCGGTAIGGCQTCSVDGDCDDADACNGLETCVGGVCQPGTPLVCDDGNPCTDDGCDPAVGCVSVANDANDCQDADVCNGAESCVAGICQPGTPLACDDGNPCTDDSCDAILGCQSVNNTAACDDNTICNGLETCVDGTCQAGTPLDCNDNNPCTIDRCDAVLGCQNVPVADGTSCDDGDICNGSEVCGAGSCLPGVALDCDDGNLCTDDLCDAVLGCQNINDNTNSCDDGDVCNGAESCSDGVCLSGTPLVCDDANACTDDSCDSINGCQFVNNDANVCDDGDPCTGNDACSGGNCAGVAIPGCFNCSTNSDCNDGDACNGSESCVGGRCEAGTPLLCEDGNPCTDDRCDAVAGCRNVANNSNSCDDGNVCNGSEQCVSGVCNSVSPLNCDDVNPCTTDTCDPIAGCQNTPDDANFCDDGNLCNGTELCMGGACVPGTPVICDDNNPCTDDVCSPVSGCQNFANNGNVCEDGNVCNGIEICISGTCTSGTPPNCDDGDLCTDDSCDPVAGCQHVSNVARCDDGNVCTDDTCDPVTGCVFTDNAAPCDDGDACTTGDTCSAGACVPGTPTVCTPPLVCDPATGICVP